jgi:hypothetical protein
VRRTIFGIAIALIGVGCNAPFGGGSADPDSNIRVEPSASPYSEITAGEVQALIPDHWHAVPAAGSADPRGGFLASPRPEAWQKMDGSTAGMSATWVDATRVGVPSDFYYLAATGPLLSTLLHSDACRAESPQVFLNDRPSFDPSARLSDGDYMASGDGTCHVRGASTRWTYFVAAPGFGPVRRVGIPSSGLYVVVAVMPDSARAETMLHRLIEHTSFGGSSVTDLVAAAGGSLRAA